MCRHSPTHLKTENTTRTHEKGKVEKNLKATKVERSITTSKTQLSQDRKPPVRETTMKTLERAEQIGKAREDLNADKTVFPDGRKRQLLQVIVWGDSYTGKQRKVVPVTNPTQAELIGSIANPEGTKHALVLDLDRYETVEELPNGKVQIIFCDKDYTKIGRTRRLVKRLKRLLETNTIGTASYQKHHGKVTVCFAEGTVFVASSTEGHGHLYIPELVDENTFKEIFVTLQNLYILEEGFVHLALKRSYASVRRRGIWKQEAESREEAEVRKETLNQERMRHLSNLQDELRENIVESDKKLETLLDAKETVWEKFGVKHELLVDREKHYAALRKTCEMQGMPYHGASVVSVRTIGTVNCEQLLDLHIHAIYEKTGKNGQSVFISIIPDNYLTWLDTMFVLRNMNVEPENTALLNENPEMLDMAVKLGAEMTEKTFQSVLALAKKL